MPGASAPGCNCRDRTGRHRSRFELQEEQAFWNDSVKGRFGFTQRGRLHLEAPSF